jgi:hypothetical protein
LSPHAASFWVLRSQLNPHGAMKKSDVIEIISTVSVVIGLVFVGVQLRQNTVVQRVTATQTLSAAYSDALEVLGYEGEAACVYVLGVNGLENLDDAQRLRFFSMWLRLFRAAEQLQYYSTQKMVEPAIWAGFERQLRELVALPGVQQWWQLRKSWFSEPFQKYVAGLMNARDAVVPQRFQKHSCMSRTNATRADNP